MSSDIIHSTAKVNPSHIQLIDPINILFISLKKINLEKGARFKLKT